jgi:hypothetical protein
MKDLVDQAAGHDLGHLQHVEEVVTAVSP